MVPAVSAHQVTKRYTSQLALDAVSLTIPEKSIYGLLGPNGAGKTTFIRILNQIIQADSGTIEIFGEQLNSNHVNIIGYLPEERGLYKKLKVGEQLLYLAQLKGLSRKEALERIKFWFEKFNIKDWWNKKVEDLSKGMAQKVQFISTVLHEPRLIILDEPFSGFDPVNAQLITENILELRDRGSTIIFSTHRMETVESLCDHIALINKAQVILEGPKKEVKSRFRSNTFLVEHSGNSLQLPSDRYQIIQQTTVADNLYETLIRASETVKGNQLIRELVEQTEVHRFEEKLPTMADIFISLVKGEGDEALRKHLKEV
ncbi:MAG: ATP-binding cassette domain-containing protein [Cyclobacteriaceae bacterium]|nr:ATP-binding cassette domain-containing protein [Cyclobacteriaceae bacterium]MCX7636359.1 ATP-binding cassette domain-containing protein [Cyclobacteriaceae bacterium]MDW8330284.1 ATP-binding cassette domain-containing protein [Cyclobacteriaceae bacterium]